MWKRKMKDKVKENRKGNTNWKESKIGKKRKRKDKDKEKQKNNKSKEN